MVCRAQPVKGRGPERTPQLAQDRAWTPSRMVPPHVDDAGLDLRRHLMRAAIGSRALVGKCREPVGGVADEPTVKGPSVDPIADRGVFDV